LLIYPNQIRPYGIPLWDHPFDPMHSLPVEAHPNLLIPLRSTGTKISFRTRVPTLDELRLCEHISTTNPQPGNPSEIIMVQAMAQGGCPTNPWKCCLATAYNYATRLEYLDANSYEALLDSIDPSLAHFSEQLKRHHRKVAQVKTVYDQLDTPARRTFVSDECRVKASAELIAERFGLRRRLDVRDVKSDNTTWRQIGLSARHIENRVCCVDMWDCCISDSES
jgi:hypothetical protein